MDSIVTGSGPDKDTILKAFGDGTDVVFPVQHRAADGSPSVELQVPIYILEMKTAGGKGKNRRFWTIKGYVTDGNVAKTLGYIEVQLDYLTDELRGMIQYKPLRAA